MTYTSSDRQPPSTQKFFRFTPQIAEKLRGANLSASEWKLWSYLVTLDPFGSKYVESPDLLDLLSECRITKSTFYRALAKLQDEGLIDSQPVKMAFRNLLGSKNDSLENSPISGTRFPEMGIESQKWESSPKNGTEFPELGLNSQNWENGSLEPLQGTEPDPPKINKISKDSLNSLRSPQTEKREFEPADPRFRAWLIKKAEKLPSPPQLLEQWIEKQACLKSNQSQFLKETAKDLKAMPPAAAPDRLSVELSCGSAIAQGDRVFAIGKLQSIWANGFHSFVEQLILDFPAWCLATNEQGVIEVEQ